MIIVDPDIRGVVVGEVDCAQSQREKLQKMYFLNIHNELGKVKKFHTS